MVYSVDSDILIHLNRYYPRTEYPKEWQLFEDLLNNGNMRISRQVYIEITNGKDNLSTWIKGFKTAIFEDTKEIQEIVSRIMNKYDFVFDPASTRNFADPYVLAVAEHLGGIVVTDEGNGLASYQCDLRCFSLKNNPILPRICSFRICSFIFFPYFFIFRFLLGDIQLVAIGNKFTSFQRSPYRLIRLSVEKINFRYWTDLIF